MLIKFVLNVLLNVNNNIELQKILFSRIKNYYKNETSTDKKEEIYKFLLFYSLEKVDIHIYLLF